MFEQLDALIFRFEELHELLSDPEVISDSKRLRELTIEEADLSPKVAKIKMILKTLLLKSAVQRVGMKRNSLPVTYSICIRDTLTVKVGRLKS